MKEEDCMRTENVLKSKYSTPKIDYSKENFNRLLHPEKSVIEKMNREFMKSVGKSEESYILYGARSSKKLVPLHGEATRMLEASISMLAEKPDNFRLESQGYGTGKEASLNSDLSAKKNVDIAIFYKENPVSVLSIKFPMTNIQQNKNNIKESMRGEACGLKSANPNLVFGQLSVINLRTPHYSGGKIKKIEYINPDSFQEYAEIESEIPCRRCSEPFKPIDMTVLAFIDSPYSDRIKECIGMNKQEFAQYFSSFTGTPKVVDSAKFSNIQGYESVAEAYGPFLDRKSNQFKDIAAVVWKTMKENGIPTRT